MSLEPLAKFFTAAVYGVIGASPDPKKYGNKVLAWYLDHGLSAFGVNPKEPTIYGIKSFPDTTSFLAQFKDSKISLSIITPPKVSTAIIRALQSIEIKNISGLWFQPGSYDVETLIAANETGFEVIAGGRCILVEGEFGLNAIGKLVAME
ncbi:CoA-binding protein [Dipodascopsis uninucleata]